jgi:hypothetical protein
MCTRIVILIALSAGLISCGLDTQPHEHTGNSWDGQPNLTADQKWRRVAYDDSTKKLTIAWEVTIHNGRSSAVETTISRLQFLDRNQLQLGEHKLSDWPTKEGQFNVAANSSHTLAGDLSMHIASIDVSNEISAMNVWASFQ